MKFIIGKKIGMTRRVEEDGKIIPVTLIDAGKNVVSLLRNKEKDGYEAVQLSWEVEKGKGYVCEFKVENEKVKLKKGDKVLPKIFEKGEKVNASGISKGKGYQGVVKRHGFSGSPATHGHRHDLRAPGSIGAAFPQRVMKGIRMAGRMGCDRVTFKTEVVDVVEKDNLLALKGALPGGRNSFVEISTLE